MMWSRREPVDNNEKPVIDVNLRSIISTSSNIDKKVDELLAKYKETSPLVQEMLNKFKEKLESNQNTTALSLNLKEIFDFCMEIHENLLEDEKNRENTALQIDKAWDSLDAVHKELSKAEERLEEEEEKFFAKHDSIINQLEELTKKYSELTQESSEFVEVCKQLLALTESFEAIGKELPTAKKNFEEVREVSNKAAEACSFNLPILSFNSAKDRLIKLKENFLALSSATSDVEWHKLIEETCSLLFLAMDLAENINKEHRDMQTPLGGILKLEDYRQGQLIILPLLKRLNFSLCLPLIVDVNIQDSPMAKLIDKVKDVGPMDDTSGPNSASSYGNRSPRLYRINAVEAESNQYPDHRPRDYKAGPI